MVAPVRLYGMDAQGHPFNHRALTIDVSLHGARVSALDCSGLVGQIVGVRYGDEKARFRVLWLSAPGSGGGQQVGLSCMDPGTYIWDVVPPERAQVTSPLQQASLQPQSNLFRMESAAPSRDRRLDERVSIGGSAQVRNCDTNAADWAGLYDLSRSGCYLETRSPWPVATHAEITIDVSGVRVQAKAQVITSHPLVGMGLRFTDMSSLNQQRLQQVFTMLGEHCAEQDESALYPAEETAPDPCPQQQPARQLAADPEDAMSSRDAVTLAQLISCRRDDAAE